MTGCIATYIAGMLDRTYLRDDNKAGRHLNGVC